MLQDFEKLSLRKFKIKSILPDATILCLGRRRSGKCLAKGTEIIMFNGEIKKVENINENDLIMGDDSTPRKVINLISGIDILYKISHKNNESYIVNSNHILSLRYKYPKSIEHKLNKNIYIVKWFDKNNLEYKSKIFKHDNDKLSKQKSRTEAKEFFNNIIDDIHLDISVKDYLTLNNDLQQNLVGYQSILNFPFKKLPMHPYLIGYWLGSNEEKYPRLITNDTHVRSYFQKKLKDYNCHLKENNQNSYDILNDNMENESAFSKTLENFDLIKEKHIPNIYLCNSKDYRVMLLAGIIDSKSTKSKKNSFEITLSKQNITLYNDIIYLCKSLGFVVYKSYNQESNILNIQSKMRIPTLVRRNFTSLNKHIIPSLESEIIIEKLETGEYYGFELDGNHRFVLGNFIVTHNSWLVRDIFYHHRHIPSGVIFSGTEEASPFFSDFIPDSFIHSEYDPELIESVMTRQKRKIRESKLTGQSETGKTPGNNIFIVLDDMLHDAQNWKKEKTIKNIFFNGRHFNFLFILTMQYPLGITPELRSNIDYIFIFNEPSMKNRKKIYDDYGGAIPSFDVFCNILDACTQNHECLVIKTSTNSTDIRDQIFWYKAEAHSNFKVGHPKLWKYHGSHYNEHYEEEAENDQFEIEKLKKKFAKTRKLKVIVTRAGEVVDVKEDSV
jgi:hypothetical protein